MALIAYHVPRKTPSRLTDSTLRQSSNVDSFSVATQILENKASKRPTKETQMLDVNSDEFRGGLYRLARNTFERVRRELADPVLFVLLFESSVGRAILNRYCALIGEEIDVTADDVLTFAVSAEEAAAIVPGMYQTELAALLLRPTGTLEFPLVLVTGERFESQIVKPNLTEITQADVLRIFEEASKRNPRRKSR